MKISVNQLGKRYGFQFVVRDVSFELENFHFMGISGRNGAGKSTLMQMISGYLSPSEGTITYSANGKNIERNDLYSHIAYAAPYIDLPQRMTTKELFDHYSKFKRTLQNYNDFVDFSELTDQGDKFIENFSSGMQQKVALALALITDVDLILFDEPTSYLDSQAKTWFFNKVAALKAQKTIIIASNDKEDFRNCQQIFEIK
jgi:ABC-type multidrug transport system ATPase subunit